MGRKSLPVRVHGVSACLHLALVLRLCFPESLGRLDRCCTTPSHTPAHLVTLVCFGVCLFLLYSFLIFKITFIIWLLGNWGVPQCTSGGQRLLSRIGSLLPPRGSQWSISGHHAWWQKPFPTEPSGKLLYCSSCGDFSGLKYLIQTRYMLSPASARCLRALV